MRYLNRYKMLIALLLLIGKQLSAQNDPDWSVNPGDFQYSMTMVATLRLDNVLSSDSKDRIGVFVGTELRGTGYLNINVPSTNQKVAFIQIYSNQVSGETLSFKVYDDSEDALIDLINEEDFVDAKKLGENLEPYELTDNHLITDISLSISSVDENAAAGTIIANLSHNDADQDQTHIFALVTGEGDTNNSDFSVSGSQLTLNAVYDFEALAALSIRLKVTDSKNAAFEETISLSVNDLNDSPTAMELSNSDFAEDITINEIIGSLSTTDQDAGDTHTYSLVAGEGDAHNALFSISGSDLLAASSFDFESLPTLNIRLRSTDEAGATFDQSFQLSLVDVNDAPTTLELSSMSIAENAGSNALIGTLSTQDPDATDSHSYDFVTGDGSADNASFAIRNGDELYSTASFDFENKALYTVRLSATDVAGESIDKAFEISITDANDSPEALSLSANVVAENLTSGQLVGSLNVTDEDVTDTHTFSLVGGNGDEGNGFFSINGNELLTSAPLDFETVASHSIRLQVEDQSGASFQKVISVSVTNQNDEPADLNLSNQSIDENNVLGALLGKISSEDQDVEDAHTYTLVAGTGDEDNASFEVSGSSLLVAKAFDFEQQSTYSVRLRSTDNAGAFFEKAFTIAVGDVNESGTVIALSANKLVENASAGSTIGALSTTDQDLSENFTYALVPGQGDSGNSEFEINGDLLTSQAVFNHESQSIYSIRIRSTDEGGNSLEEEFTINIEDVNEVPESLSLSANSLPENSPQSTQIATLLTNDVDDGDSFVYGFVSGSGDTDNALFTIQGNAVYTTQSFDFESKSTYNIRIATTDQGGESLEQSFNILITDANDDPTALNLSVNNVDENNTIGEAIGTLSTVDQDESDSHTYTLVSGLGDEDNAGFEVDGEQLIALQSFDFETRSSYAVRLRATDAAGSYVESSIEIRINDLNEAGTSINLSANVIDENSSTGTVIGSFVTVDEDAGDTFSYALIAGEGDTDNAAFTLDNDELKTAVELNFETKSDYSIRVQSTDSQGNRVESQFDIMVADLNEAPTALSLSGNSVEENSAGGSVIGLLEAVDEDVDDAYAYVLKEGVDDNSFFGINGGNQLVVAGVLNFEVKPDYTVVIEVIDSDGNRFEESFVIEIINIPESNIIVSDSELDFGTVAVGQSATKSITINNTGPDGVLTISGIGLPAGFVADQSNLEVPPGESVSLNLTFEPEAVATVEGVMTLTSNAGLVEIQLTAQAELVTSLEPVDFSNSVGAFPIPASRLVTLDLVAFAGKPYDLEILKTNGKPLLSLTGSSATEQEIDVSTWTEGLYILIVQSEGKLARKKLMIRR